MTTDPQTQQMFDDLMATRAADLRTGTLSFGRTGGNAAGAKTRYRVTVVGTDSGTAYFIGHVAQVNGTWVALARLNARTEPFGHSSTRLAAGGALRDAAIEAADATVAARS